MLKGIKKNPFNLSILIGTATLMVTFSLLAVKFSAIIYILVSGALGVFAYLIGNIKRSKEGEK